MGIFSQADDEQIDADTSYPSFTKEELEEISDCIYRLDDLNDCHEHTNLLNKIQLMINTIPSALRVFTHHPDACPHDYQPASVSQWGHQFNQCIKCGEIE